MAKKTITFNIEEADLAKLDEYATNLERDRTYVLNQAVKMYIADAEREAAEDEEILRGPFYSPDEVSENVRRHIAAMTIRRQELDEEQKQQEERYRQQERKSA